MEPDIPITPPTVKLLRPSRKERGKKTLVCVATGFYPDHVAVYWTVGGDNTTRGVATDSQALREGNSYSITSRLRVSSDVWFNKTTFTCTVSFYNGDTYDYISDTVDGDEAEEELMTREKYLRITQSAKLSYSVIIFKSCIYGAFVAFLVWRLQGSPGKHSD